MLEIIGQHRLAALMGELVGIERDERAAEDEEQPKADPGGDERRQSRPVERAAGALRAGQRIDDAAEQHRLGERRRGERDIGERQQPAQPHLRAEQAEHAGVEVEHGVRRGRLESRLRGPGAHAWRPVRLRVAPLQRLHFVVAARVGDEAEIGAPAAGATRRGVHIGIDRRPPALEDLRRLDDGGGRGRGPARSAARRSPGSARRC